MNGTVPHKPKCKAKCSPLWILYDLGDGKMAFRNYGTGKYLVADDDKKMYADRDHLDEWEKFIIGGGGVCEDNENGDPSCSDTTCNK